MRPLPELRAPAFPGRRRSPWPPLPRGDSEISIIITIIIIILVLIIIIIIIIIIIVRRIYNKKKKNNKSKRDSAESNRQSSACSGLIRALGVAPGAARCS